MAIAADGVHGPGSNTMTQVVHQSSHSGNLLNGWGVTSGIDVGSKG